MRTTRRSVLAGAAMLGACATPPASARLGGVRRFDAALDALIAPDAAVQEIAAGFQWAEGPVWVRTGGALLFTDPPNNVIHRWRAAAGAERFIEPSGFAGADGAHLREPGANGLAIDAGGALVMCDSGNRALARMDLATRRKQILAERYRGMRFNSPNDLAIARSGAIYFTDPPFGLAGIEHSPARETPFHGVYRWRPDGAVDLITDELTFPNGIALSPDERTLYVSCTDARAPRLMAYALGEDGLARGGRVFFDAAALQQLGAPGHPDGMKLDAAGNLFATGPGGAMVIAPDGRLLGLIEAGRAIANCAFGEDGRTLFLAAHDRIARIRLRTRG